MLSPSRLAAYHALLAVETGRDDLPSALERGRATLPDRRDRALAAEIATGTLRWQGQLDFLIEHVGRRSAARLDPEVLITLRLGAYQLLHLSRVPVAAAISDAVNLTRRVRKASAAGFVNAVLRAISRERSSLPLPRLPTPDALAQISTDFEARQAALDYLSITLSHPRWLAHRWLDRYGFDIAVRWERFNNAAAPLTVRTNTLRMTRDDLARQLQTQGVTTRPTVYAPDGLVVTDGHPLHTRLSDQGAFFVQDEASQLVALLADARPGNVVLDCCASPGGKATAMAAAMRDDGFIAAGDVRSRRIELLQRTTERSGAHSIHVLLLDARHQLPFRGAPFDVVLVDAPCSGLGTIRRDPEIRWRRREGDLSRFADEQLRMVENAAAVVRVGGRMVYATCSSEPEENENVVAQFLSRTRLFVLADTKGHASAQLAGVLDERGLLRTSPAAHGLEAFFGAVMLRVA